MATINLAEYQYTLALDDSAYQKSMQEAESTADSMKTKMDSVGGYLKTALTAGLAAAGVAVVAAVKSGVDAAAGLDEQMSKLQSSTGATADEVEKVRNIAKDLYAVNTDSMEDIVATSSAMMTQMGATAEQVGALQQGIMGFAKTTGMANTDVVSAVDDIGDAWGMTAEESVAFLDVLKKSSEEYGTDVAGVASALTSVAPAAKALGLSVEEVNGYMNLFADSGLEANQAITALTYAAKQVESPEAFRTMLADIQAIEDPTQRAQAAVELFGAKAGVALANAFDGTTDLEAYTLSLEECAGAVSAASASFDNNFNVQLQLLQKQFSSVAIEIGESLLPVLNTVMGWISTNLPVIIETVRNTIDNVVAFFQPLYDALSTFFDTLTAGSSNSNETFVQLQETVSGVLSAIQEVISGFVELVSAFWAEWGDEIMETVSNAFDNIMQTIDGVLTVIKDILSVFTSALKGDWEGAFEALKNVASDGWKLIQDIFNGIVEPIKNILGTVITAVKNWATEMISNAKTAATNFISNAVTALKNLPANIYDAIKDAINRVATWGTEMKNKAVSAMSNLVTGIVNALSGLPSKMLDIGTNLVKGIWNGINNAVGWVLDKIRGFGASIVNGIKNIFGIHSPSKLMEDEVGKYLAEGIGVGFTDEIGKVNKQIRDSIDTDFDVKANVLSNLHGNSAYQTAAANRPGESAGNQVHISFGDTIIQGNASAETVQAHVKVTRDMVSDIAKILKIGY